MAKHMTHTGGRTSYSYPKGKVREEVEELPYRELRKQASAAGVYKVGMTKEEIREALIDSRS